MTRFHNANCLRAILNGAPRDCLVHGFRDFGFLWQIADWAKLGGADDQFCPCPEHPWRSFVLNGPHTWEAHHAARRASEALPPREYNFQQEHEQVQLVFAEYCDSQQKWVAETGRQLPSRDEILELHRIRAKRAQGARKP